MLGHVVQNGVNNGYAETAFFSASTDAIIERYPDLFKRFTDSKELPAF